MKDRTKLITALAIHALIVIFEVIGLVMNLLEMGSGIFVYYTQDSNCFAMVTSLFFVIFGILELTKGKRIPKIVYDFVYFSTCCLTVTFLVVIFVLIPIAGMQSFTHFMFGGASLFQHTLCPLMAIASLIFFLPEHKVDKKTVFISLIPTVIYAVVAIVLNIAKVIDGPYPFLKVYNQPAYMSVIWCVAILGLALFISWGLKFIHNKLIKQ